MKGNYVLTRNEYFLSGMMENYLVVGAGISGATVSGLLSNKTTARIDLIERKFHVGGNCHDYRNESNIMIHDSGSHIFHTFSKKIWDYLTKITEFNTYQHRVLAYVGGNVVPIPFCLETLYKVFPYEFASRMEVKLLERYPYDSKISIVDFMSQDDEDLRFLAKYIYDNIFLHYTEKQWGKSPDKIDKTITARVPIILNNDTRYFQDSYQGIPVCGYTEMIRRMIDRPNINLILDTEFKDIINPHQYDRIFFTGPVDELMDYQLGILPYRSERFVFETHNCEYYQDAAVVNYPNDYDFTRIHEYKYYLNDKSPVTVIAKEYPEEFVPGKNEPYYPVLGKENEELYRRYIEIAQRKYPNMVFLGRLGDYRYYNMDQAIARAMEVAEEYIQSE